MGWATAWSFDRLRLWAEDGVAPGDTLRWTAVYTMARTGLLLVWCWHGLIPKLLFPQADETAMLAAQGLGARWLPVAGAGEIALALLGLAAWRWRGFFLLSAGLMVAASVAVLRTPEYLTRAFNPVTLNLSMFALAAIGYAAWPRAAFAGWCLRRPREPADRGT